MPSLQTSYLIFSAALVLSACSPPRDLPLGDDDRPDIVLISIDSLRSDHLGCYGHSRDTSPFLDRLAKEGALFAEAWAPSPWTLPSHATMMTGLLTHRHHAIDQETPLGSRVPLLADELSQAGYATYGAVSSTYVSSQYGFDRGFDRFEDFGINSPEIEPALAIFGLDAELLLSETLAWSAGQPDGQAQFVFVHLFDVHYPYAAPPPWDERFGPPTREGDPTYVNYEHYQKHPLSAQQLARQIEQYDEEISYVDDRIRRFHSRWVADRPRSIFVVVSDHGEEFGERGSWGHAHTLMPELLRIPWIVSGHGIAAQRIPTRVGLEDLPVTLLSLAGIAFPGSDGVDRAQLLLGLDDDSAEPSGLFASSSRLDTLLHRWHEPPHDLVIDLRESQFALVDLAQDPTAHSNILAKEEARASELNEALFQYLGQPWKALAPGLLETDGVVVIAGELRQSPVSISAGQQFALFPADAKLTLATDSGERSGPWVESSGALPGSDDPALAYEGDRPGTEPVELTPEQKERLESLGYLQ